MKTSFIFSIALLVLALAGCKGGGEAAVIGKWKGDTNAASGTTANPAMNQVQSLISSMQMDVEIKADHKYKMTLMGLVPIEGDWVMNANQVTLTPKTIAGMTVEEAMKQAKQKNPSAMAMAGSSPGTQTMVLELQPDGKTLKLITNRAEAGAIEKTFTKQ